MHNRPRHIGVAGFFAAAGNISRTFAAGGHGFANGHKGLGDVGVAGVIFQAAVIDGVLGFQHHGGLDFRGVFDFPCGREELAHQLENTLADGSGIDTDTMPQPVYDAVVSFAFNVGPGAACRSTLAFFVNKSDWHSACNQLPRWVYVNGVKTKGLERRRVTEQKHCLSGA